MKSLKFKRLSGLQPDTFIKVIYGRNRKFSGYVAGNDCKKSIEILNSKGELLVISYNEIKSFIIKNNTEKIQILKPVQKTKHIQTVIPDIIKPEEDSVICDEDEYIEAVSKESEEIQTTEEEEIIPEPVSEPLTPSVPICSGFFEKEGYIKISETDQNYIVNLYNYIDDKSVKKSVNRYFDSFMSGVKNHDNEKCLCATDDFSRNFSEYGDNQNAVKLLAYMYIYAGDFSKAYRVFEKAGDLFNASVYGYLSGDFENAGANAYSYIKNQLDNKEKCSGYMLYILINSTIKTDNVFGICELVKDYGMISCDENITSDDCLDYLLFRKGVIVSGNPEKKLESLSGCYKICRYEAFTDINDFPEGVIFGYVFKVPSPSCMGVIYEFSSPGKEFTFNRSAVKDNEFASKLSDPERNVDSINVAFTSIDGKNASDVSEISLSPEIMAVLGEKYYEKGEYKSALDCFCYAFSMDTRKEDMFFKATECYLILVDSESGGQYSRYARKFIEKNHSLDVLDKYRFNETCFKVYSKTNDSSAKKKYIDKMLKCAETPEKRLDCLTLRAELLFDGRLYSDSLNVLSEWVDFRRNNYSELPDKYNKIEKEKILPLMEKCRTIISETEKIPVDDSENSAPQTVEEPEIVDNKDELPAFPVKIPRKAKKVNNTPKPEPAPKFKAIFAPDMGILPETLEKPVFSIIPHPERNKNNLKNFAPEFKRLINKYTHYIPFIALFIARTAEMIFFSEKLIRQTFDAELNEKNETDYTVVDFIIDFFYSFGIIEKISFNDDVMDFYFLTKEGMEYLKKDGVKKALKLSSPYKFAPILFESQEPEETGIYKNHYGIISEAVSPYSKKYFLNITRCGWGYFPSVCAFMRKSKGIMGKGKFDCGLIMITPFVPDNPDRKKYNLYLQCLSDVIKNRIESNLKDSEKLAVIIISSSYGMEWFNIFSDVFENIIADRNFYILHNGEYSDLSGKSITIEEIMSLLLSDSSSDEPDTSDNPDTPDNPDSPDNTPDNNDNSDNSDASDIPEDDDIIEDDDDFIPDIDNAVYDEFMNDTSLISVSDEQVKSDVCSMLETKKYYCALTYLEAVSKLNENYKFLYNLLSMALDNPAEDYHYTSSEIFSIPEMSTSFDAGLYECCMLSAEMRAVYYNDCVYDYSVNSFAEGIKNNQIAERYPELKTLADIFTNFRCEFNIGMDCIADYCMKDKMSFEEKINELRRKAKNLYGIYCNSTESFKNLRIKIYKGIMFSQNNELMKMLSIAVNGENERCSEVEKFLLENFIKDKCDVSPANVTTDKIKKYIEKIWDESNNVMKKRGKVTNTSELISDTRRHSNRALKQIASILSEWVMLIKKGDTFSVNEVAVGKYQKEREDILGILNELIEATDKSGTASDSVINRTIRDICSRIDGSYDVEMRKYYFIDFLRNDLVILDESGFPDLSSTFCFLPDFNIVERIKKHASEPGKSFEERLNEIFSKTLRKNDYGSAKLINEYLMYKSGSDENLNKNIEHLEDFSVYSEKKASVMKNSFIEDTELAYSYGQFYKRDRLKELMNSVSGVWYKKCCEGKNYGFYAGIIESLKLLIRSEAEKCGISIKKRRDEIKETYNLSDDKLFRVDDMISKLNYTVAEHYMNLIVKGENIGDTDIIPAEIDYLRSFWEQYPENYDKCNGSGLPLSKILGRSNKNKNTKGGAELISSWIMNGSSGGSEHIESLLRKLGWKNCHAESKGRISRDVEKFSITLDKPKDGRRANYKHPIAVFGSQAEQNGFNVLCCFGIFSADGLLDKFREIGNAANTLVLLDYALTEPDRRHIARKIKEDRSISKVFAVIDRVVITYLALNYSEANISRMLMAVIMPFSSYQPYVHESSKIMPAEMFTGRDAELSSIESPAGVNIIYGGRQLGKSALLKMARKEIDCNENGDRAVLVDINKCGIVEAAKKVADELKMRKIISDKDYDGWDSLCYEIKCRLMDTEKERIPYLLLMMDEADKFIDECSKCEYKPFEALKDVQNIGENRFKFVIAGLRDVIRFNREINLGGNSVIAHLTSLIIKSFSEKEGRELLLVPLSYLGIYFEKYEMASLILAKANYFPGLIHYYCLMLIETMCRDDYAGYNETNCPPYIVTENHIKKVLSDEKFNNQIKEKFEITLRSDELSGDRENGYNYYVIALIIAYLCYTNDSGYGYTAEEIKQTAGKNCVDKIFSLSIEKLSALLDELCSLGILLKDSNKKYSFQRDSFCAMMGANKEEVEDKILEYASEYSAD